MKAVLLLCALGAVVAAPNPDCPAVLAAGGLTERFPGLIAHSLHSITLQDLRYYFEPRATVDNHIPMINLDLNSDTPFLFNAPDEKADPMFVSMAMRAVDKVLSHMDDNDYDVKLYSPLERIVHALHMHEVWTKTQAPYQALKRNPPSDPDFCPCVTDIDSNGVLMLMRILALKIREPAVLFGSYEQLKNQAEAEYYDVSYSFSKVDDLDSKPKPAPKKKPEPEFYDVSYSFNKVDDLDSKPKPAPKKKPEPEFYDVSYSFSKVDDLDSKPSLRKKREIDSKPSDKKVDNLQTALFDSDNASSNLDSSDVWAEWKSGLKNMKESDFKEIASFLYCSLKQ